MKCGGFCSKMYTAEKVNLADLFLCNLKDYFYARHLFPRIFTELK